MAEQQFDVFLCHNSEDKPAVIEIAQQLRANGLNPWLDVSELQPGGIWQFELEQQIESIKAVAVFVGQQGLGPWQSEEIYAFLQEFIRRKCPVIPVMLHNAPKKPKLPIFLKNRHWVDFRLQKPDPFLQLVWGITGKRPDGVQNYVYDFGSISLTLRKTPRTAQGYIEPLLDVGDAIPLHMALIPGGTFTMGSPEDEPERFDGEGPQHDVTVPTFFMGRYPVTQAQYEAVMGRNPATKYDTERFVAPNKPVVGVTWDDAVEFCQRLTELTDRPYRLASEAEWEYACRASTTTPFYFGYTLTSEIANYYSRKSYANGPEGEYRNTLTLVNLFGIANAFGLSDMHGNVNEWCQDHWHENYDRAPIDGNAWIKDESLPSRRVLRGGAWEAFPDKCRSAYRGRYNPTDGDISTGFRIVCSAPRILL